MHKLHFYMKWMVYHLSSPTIQTLLALSILTGHFALQYVFRILLIYIPVLVSSSGFVEIFKLGVGAPLVCRGQCAKLVTLKMLRFS